MLYLNVKYVFKLVHDPNQLIIVILIFNYIFAYS